MKANILLIILFFLPYELVYGKTSDITVWNYYRAEPLASDQHKGLIYDFVTLLNARFHGKYHFNLQSIPRARLNHYLDNDKQGIVLFVNERWMEMHGKQHYLWTKALTLDQNLILSHRDNPFIFHNVHSLEGMRFAKVRGRKLDVIDPWIATGDIINIDANNETQLFELLLNKRVDVISLPRIIANKLKQNLDNNNKIIFQNTPLYVFERKIMVTEKLTNLHADLQKMIKDLPQDLMWQELVYQYKLDKPH